jgi:hypothetical protein
MAKAVIDNYRLGRDLKSFQSRFRSLRRGNFHFRIRTTMTIPAMTSFEIGIFSIIRLSESTRLKVASIRKIKGR